MKKILFIINYITNGGPSKVLLNIINNLDKKKFEVTLLTIFNKNNKDVINELYNNGVEVKQLNYNKSLKTVIRNYFTIINYISDFSADIIHTHGLLPTIFVSNKKIKSYKITTIHNNIFEDYKYTYGFMKGFVYSIINIIILRKFQKIICCSKTSFLALRKYVKNISYIQNGIDIRNKSMRDKIRNEYNISKNDIIYIYAGNVSKLKRVEELVKLFNNNLSEKEFLFIIGDGEKLEEIPKNNSHIFFLGFKNNVLDYFSAADVYVSYSMSEGFSISIIEALANNLLLLISHIDAHKECFEIDKNFYIGETFNENNFGKKKQYIFNYLKDNKIIKTKEFQKKYLSGKCMTKKYEKYYNKVEEKGNV